jgi:serine/threonine-protein kinase
MISNSANRIMALFEQAIELPTGARESFLAHACSGDAMLLGRVRELLAADRQGHALLDESRSGFLDAMLSAALPAPHAVPDIATWRVGPYRLERELGRGGMGVVYQARRDDLKNRVALKLLLRGTGSHWGTEWFRREQAVHARLEHPNIARLLDAGVADDGTPWMVMEYVEGVAIDQHCRERRLNLAGRLTLFQQVAEAVAYAHQNMVVHRDIKPSNILVTGDGTPKLVDFGIAKVLASNAAGVRPGEETAAGR